MYRQNVITLRAPALCAAVTLAVLTPLHPARAFAPSAEEQNEVGRALYDQGRYSEAAEAFAAAYAESGDPNLLYNISVCYDRADELERALDYLTQYIEVAPQQELAELQRDRTILEERLAMREAPPEAEPEPVPAATVQDDRKPPPDKVMTPAVWATLGVGTVAIIVGGGLGIASLRAGSRADDSCAGDPAICTPQGQDAEQRAQRTALGADISFGVGAAGLVTGAAIAIANVVKRKQYNEQPHVSVSAGWNGFGVSGRF